MDEAFPVGDVRCCRKVGASRLLVLVTRLGLPSMVDLVHVINETNLYGEILSGAI